MDDEEYTGYMPQSLREIDDEMLDRIVIASTMKRELFSDMVAWFEKCPLEWSDVESIKERIKELESVEYNKTK
jgi:hypothetical protein